MAGAYNKTMGKTKKTIGRITGDRKLEAKGALQSGKGKVQSAGRKVKRTLRNAKVNVRAKVSKRPMRKTTSVRVTTGRNKPSKSFY